MKIQPAEPNVPFTPLKPGDMVIHEGYGVSIVAPYYYDGQYGLLNLEKMTWSSVSRDLKTLHERLLNEWEPPRISPGNAWTLTETGV